MAAIHVGQGTVISLDIKDFFPSIKQWMVQEALVSMGMGETPAVLLSELCTFKSYVPQGALTSPKVSNLITAGTFGPEVAEFCTEKGYQLSIYADDVTISFTSVELDGGRAQSSEAIRFVTETLSKYRFKVNRAKTKIMLRHRRQWVCGAVVNDRVNLRRTERARLKAIVHNCEQRGIEHEAQVSGKEPLSFIRVYAGRLNWFTQLNPDAGRKLLARFKACASTYTGGLGVEIPELSWNSSVEISLSPEDENEERNLLPQNENGADQPAPF